MRKANLSNLRMFDVAAKHLNFRLAAEELNVTQGAVAQQVRKLEAELATPLFNRQARGLSYTRAGREYHSVVQQALQMIDQATESMRQENKSQSLSLSVPPSLASKWLVPKLVQFRQLHPEVEVNLIAQEQLANFHSDGIDFSIRITSPPFDQHLQAQCLTSLQLMAVCSTNMAKSISIDAFSDFAQYPLIEDSHQHWKRRLSIEQTHSQHRLMHFNQTALAIDAALHGQGIALAPKLLVEEEINKGLLQVLWRDDGASCEGYYLISPKAQKTSIACDQLMQWVLSFFDSPID